MRFVLTMIIALGSTLPAIQAAAQLDIQRTMRNPSLAPRTSVIRQSAPPVFSGYIPLDRQAGAIERGHRKNMAEDRNLEYRSELPTYSRERQQVRDRIYSDFRDVKFINATLKRDSIKNTE
jgi:hypothetical protein